MALRCSACRCRSEQAERAMHAVNIVARVVGPCLHGVHAKRAAACERAVVAVVLGAALSLSGIALGVRSVTGYRHRVKSVDRVLGNGALHAARAELYAAVAARRLTGVRELLLVIDWSDLTRDQRWHWLRASVAVRLARPPRAVGCDSATACPGYQRLRASGKCGETSGSVPYLPARRLRTIRVRCPRWSLSTCEISARWGRSYCRLRHFRRATCRTRPRTGTCRTGSARLA
jgi:hypothetical protein